MGHEILTSRQMIRADRLTIESGLFDGYALMLRAGEAVTAEILGNYADCADVDVLCGPGNNGGDGYVIARLLAERGLTVRVFATRSPKPGSDAAHARSQCPLTVSPLTDFQPKQGGLVIDALYGTGFSGQLDQEADDARRLIAESGNVCVAVDIPSGVNGDSGHSVTAVQADSTITFARKKPCHILYPGRRFCGKIVVVDIGIRDAAIVEAMSDLPPVFENGPWLWRDAMPSLATSAHKYSRGHAAVFSGGSTTTGAARLAAIAAARVGAGAVTVISPPEALAVNAAHLTSIMVAERGSPEATGDFLQNRKVRAVVIGPGFGIGGDLRVTIQALLTMPPEKGVVLDADAISSFADEPEALFDAVARSPGEVVLTPHEGEFARLFSDLSTDPSLSKIEKARRAAARSHATIIYKGADTVVAAPDGRVAVNTNGTALLATAGSGDVLAGLTVGLMAQRMPSFEAACAAVWMHAEAARLFGHGLIAEDIPAMIPQVLAQHVYADG